MVTYCDRILSVVVHHSSCVNFLHFRHLLKNHWANFNQTWSQASVPKGASKLQNLWSPPPGGPRGGAKTIEKRVIFKNLLLYFCSSLKQMLYVVVMSQSCSTKIAKFMALVSTVWLQGVGQYLGVAKILKKQLSANLLLNCQLFVQTYAFESCREYYMKFFFLSFKVTGSKVKGHLQL